MKLVIAILLAPLLTMLPGCDSAKQAEKLKAENDVLRADLEAVTRERDELKFGASRVLPQAEAEATKANWPKT